MEIAVPPTEQVKLVPRLLDAGKHILAQKPLAPTGHEAESLLEDAEGRGLTLCVNQQMRLTDVVQRFRAPGSPQVERFTVMTHLPLSDSALPPWFRDSARKTVLFNTLHFIDSAVFLMGRPESITAYMEVASPPGAGEASVVLSVRFPDGRRADISESRSSNGSPACMLRLDAGSEVAMCRFGVWDSYPSAAPDDLWVGTDEGLRRQPVQRNWVVDAFVAALAQFVAQVNGQPGSLGARTHIDALHVVDAAYLSTTHDARPWTIEYE